jgi:hypothetical protein
MTRKNPDAELEMWPALFSRLRQWFGGKRDMQTTERDHARRWRDRVRNTTREACLMHLVGLYLCEAEKAGAIQWQGLRRHDSPDDPTHQDELDQEEKRRLDRVEMESRISRARAWQDAQDAAWFEATKELREQNAKRTAEARLAAMQKAQAKRDAKEAARKAAKESAKEPAA